MRSIQIKRYGGIDLLKHLLAIFVIFHHMISESRYSEDTNLFIESIVHYMNGAVIGFFLVSGFFFKFNGSLKDSLIKIFSRTMIPFFLFSILYTILLSMLGKQAFVEGIYRTLILKGSSMQLYFLSFLFIIYMFYLSLFHFLSEKKVYMKYMLIFVMIILAILSYLYPTTTASGNDYKLLILYTLSFGISIYLSIVRKENEKIFYINALIIVLVSLLVGILDYRFIHIAVMITLLTLFYFLSNILPFLTKQFPGSGGIYLLHTPIVNFGVSSVLIYLGYIERLNVLLTIIITYILTLSITLIFIKIFPKQKFVLLE